MPGNQPAKRRVGRPSSFDPDDLPRITELTLLGLTNEQLAGFCQVDVSTVERWIKNNPEFRGAVNAGRIGADGKVARSLWSRANGYSHPEEKLFFDGQSGGVVRAETTKHYPPDAASMIFWLKNRRPDLWRDLRNTELSGPGGGPIRTEAVEARQLEVGERQTLRAFLEARADAEDAVVLDDDDEAEQNEENDDGDDTR